LLRTKLVHESEEGGKKIPYNKTRKSAQGFVQRCHQLLRSHTVTDEEHMNIKHWWNKNNSGYIEKFEENYVPLSCCSPKTHMGHVSRLSLWILIQKILISIPDQIYQLL